MNAREAVLGNCVCACACARVRARVRVRTCSCARGAHECAFVCGRVWQEGGRSAFKHPRCCQEIVPKSPIISNSPIVQSFPIISNSKSFPIISNLPISNFPIISNSPISNHFQFSNHLPAFPIISNSPVFPHRIVYTRGGVGVCGREEDAPPRQPAEQFRL